MPKKVKLFAAGLLVAVVGTACFAMVGESAHAEEANSDQAKDASSLFNGDVMTIKSNEDWSKLKSGDSFYVERLVIGKDVTTFGSSPSSDKSQNEADVRATTLAGYSRFYDSYQHYDFLWDIFPSEIVVESANSVFRVIDGLLINEATNELVLSEMDVTDVEIPEGVQSIGWKAFYKRPLTSVHFAKSVQKIGHFAFAGCENLKSVSLPDSVTRMGMCAFFECEALEEVVLPKQLQQIEAYTFSYCSMKSLEIPGKILIIGPGAFSECKQLEQVKLNTGLTKIDVYAFHGCLALTNINFPEGLVSIGEGTFGECQNLRRVILPDSLQLIGEYTFYKCNLSILRFPPKLYFQIYDSKKGYIVYPHAKDRKRFLYDAVETVIFSGSDYDFGYPAISHAHNVYFLGKPPEDVGQILDKNSVESIFCSDEFEHEWTRSTVASWVRQRLTILPAEQLKQITDQEINATPLPTDMPRPTPRPTETPWPTPKPRPTASPERAAQPEQQPADPLVFAFAGILALVIAGIVVVAVKSRRPKKCAHKRK